MNELLDNKCIVNEILYSKILKEVCKIFGKVILILVNTSQQSAVIPDAWKVSTGVPIPKVTNTIKYKIYRNQLYTNAGTHRKVLELIVYIQILEYVDKTEIILEYHSCFKEKHCWETALQLYIMKSMWLVYF